MAQVKRRAGGWLLAYAFVHQVAAGRRSYQRWGGLRPGGEVAAVYGEDGAGDE